MSVVREGGVADIAVAPIHKPTVFWSAFGTVGLVGFAVWLPFFAFRFRQLFADLGTRLPRITSLLITSRLSISAALLAFALLQAVVVGVYVARRHEELRRAAWLFFALDIVIVAGIVFCFYLPVEQLGSST